MAGRRRVTQLAVLVAAVWLLLNASSRLNHFSREYLNPPTPVTSTFGVDRRELLRSPPVSRWEGWKKTRLGESACFYVENVCHSAGLWFYNPSENDRGYDLHQPRVHIRYIAGVNMYLRHWGYQFNQTIATLGEEPTKMIPNATNLKCMYSHIPNHLTMHAMYNEMLGEYYDRSLVRMWNLLSEFPSPQELNGFLEETQFYIHVDNPSRTLMESHHAFSNLFRQAHPLLDFKALFEEASCRCMSKLIFCGYGHNSVKEKGPSKAEEQSIHERGSDEDDEAWDLKADGDGRNFLQLGGRRSIVHNLTRTAIRQGLVVQNPIVKSDVTAYRNKIIQEYAGNVELGTDAYKIIGLTQRSGRRKWKDLNLVVDHLRSTLSTEFLIFVEINVEDDDWNPHEHMIRHAALDGLVGIHGAQLTEAIWLPPGSLVVELLPYIPEIVGWGHWVRTVKAPTPLGIIFDESDLEHVGYVLPEESSPDCSGTEGPDCWTRHRWDERQFEVEPAVLERILRIMITDKRKSIFSSSCQDLVDRAKDFGQIVLYNVNCRDEANEPISPHHYYWSEKDKW